MERGFRPNTVKSSNGGRDVYVIFYLISLVKGKGFVNRKNLNDYLQSHKWVKEVFDHFFEDDFFPSSELIKLAQGYRSLILERKLIWYDEDLPIILNGWKIQFDGEIEKANKKLFEEMKELSSGDRLSLDTARKLLARLREELNKEKKVSEDKKKTIKAKVDAKEKHLGVKEQIKNGKNTKKNRFLKVENYKVFEKAMTFYLGLRNWFWDRPEINELAKSYKLDDLLKNFLFLMLSLVTICLVLFAARFSPYYVSGIFVVFIFGALLFPKEGVKV